MPLRDAEFFVSQDLFSILALSAGRRRCQSCAQCEACSFSLAYNSWEQERQTQVIDQNIEYNEEEGRFEVEYSFHEPNVFNGISINGIFATGTSAITPYSVTSLLCSS